MTKFYNKDIPVYMNVMYSGREVIEPLETKINEIIDKINSDFYTILFICYNIYINCNYGSS